MKTLPAPFACALALILAAAASLPAHGPTDGLDQWGLDEAALHGKAPVPGLDAVARGLLRHGAYNFAADGLRLLHKSNALYLSASEVPVDGHDHSATITAAAETLLERLLQDARVAVEVTVEDGRVSMDWDRVHRLPREGGVILLRVSAGAAGARAFTVEKDLETHQEHNDPLVIPFHGAGQSWILLRLLNPPLEKCVVQFTLQDDADPRRKLPCLVRVESEPMGTLRFTVRDERGLPCPAMVELKSVRTGHIYRPAAAVEFSPQMEHIAGTPVHSPDRPDAGQGVPYMASIPGDAAGLYYCVDRPFEMAIPAGEWSVKVWRGVEYELAGRSVTITAGKTTVVDIALNRWIDMAARGWHSGDGHIHSRLMSDQDADRLLTFMEATDLAVGNVLLMGNYLRTYYPQRGFGRAFRVERGGRVLVPGQEDPRYMNGHAVGLNITALVRDESRYLYNDWVADEIRAQGGLYGFAHLIGGAFNIIRDMVLLMPDGRGDFGEIQQSGILDTDLYYDFLNLGFELAAGAGSDVPYSHLMGEVRVYCHTGEPVVDADAWFDALRDGRTFVTNGPILEFSVDGALPGTRLQVGAGHTLSVTASVKAPPGGGAPQRLELVWLGDVIASRLSADTSAGELSLTVDVPAGFGGWIAVRAYGHDGTSAHTTPVYVRREGFRPWNTAKAAAIIGKCLHTIAHYREELQRFAQLAGAGALPPHHVYGRQLAAMVPGGLERADRAQNHYTGLQRLLDEEIKRRAATLRAE